MTGGKAVMEETGTKLEGIKLEDLGSAKRVSAAREVSRSVVGRHNIPRAPYSTPSLRNHASPAADIAAKAEAGL
jgi:hypothetical protein